MPDALPERLFSGPGHRPSGAATLVVLFAVVACLLVLAAVPLSEAFSARTNRLHPSTALPCHVLNGSFESERVYLGPAPATTRAVAKQLSSDLAKLIGVEETLSEQPTRQQPGDLERWLMLDQAVQRDRAELLVVRLSGGGNRPKPAASATAFAAASKPPCI